MKIYALHLLPLAFLACTDAVDPADGEADCFSCDGKADGLAVTEGSCEATHLLAFVSDAKRSTLDHDVGLDARAARNIAGHGRIETLAELDAIPYVGPIAFARLIAYAGAHGVLSCADAVTLTENDPNTEFSETFVALQENASGDCLPSGRAFSYSEATTDDLAVANGVIAQFTTDAESTITTNLSRTVLAQFLQSFGFDLDGLHSAIGFDDYVLARARLATAEQDDEVMILHYRTRREVWTVSLSCPAGI